jgi:N-methylhydantoinase B
VGRKKLDPITLAVLRSGLINAVAEMKAVVIRTAYSNLWKEAGDLSCGLLTSSGELAVQGVGDIPIHLASMPMSLGACLKRIPPATLEPGDVVYQNDPYQGNNHLPDFIMGKPVFFDGRIVAYTAVRGHYVDIGGGGPGSYSATMPDIYAEGLRIPPVRIFEKGVINQDIVDVLLHNTRNSRERYGDLRSQFAGCVAAERRVISFCEKYGAKVFEAAMKEIIDAGERLTRLAIEKIPDGVYSFEDHCDNDAITEVPIKIAVQVSVKGSDIEVDFNGSSPQVRGGMNAPIAVTVSATCYAIKCLTDPENEPNSGSYRPIKVVAPIGSVVNPIAPAPVIAGNHETASRIADAIIGALAKALPDRVCAAGSGSSGILSLGTRIRDGLRERELLLVEPHGSGQGANCDGDGVNARRVSVGNTGNTPCEALEISFPIHILRYAISEDGGGAGRLRGGTGILREVRLDHDATVTLTADRAKFGPYGLFGGLAAPKAEFWVRLPDGSQQILSSKTAPLHFPKGTIVHFRCAGGGGYGPPRDREIERIQADLDDGYVSLDAVQKLYDVTVKHQPDRPEGPWVAIPQQQPSSPAQPGERRITEPEKAE